MKITDVRALQPIAANSPPDWRTTFGQVLVAIDTDVGLTGYGVGGGGQAGIAVIRTVLRDTLLGRTPHPIEPLWQSMYQATLPFGRRGLAIMALSGVDLALWDLHGKSERCAVAKLLGGAKHTSLPTYLTIWGQLSPTEVGQHAAYKLHIGQNAETGTVVELAGTAVERARQLLGVQTPLMLDAWMKWDITTTLRVAERVVALGVDWIEEPLSPDDLAGYTVLRDLCPIPIAGGEHEFTAFGFAPLIEQRLHRILQPDVCWCGGMTQLIKIYRMAHAAGLRVCPHRGAELWSLPALAALDPEPLAESGRPWLPWVGGQPPIVEGRIAVPEAPGFGVFIDEGTCTFLPLCN